MPVELPTPEMLEQRVFGIDNEKSFTEIALAVFRLQYYDNPVYQRFCRALHRHPEAVTKIADIPYLPVSFFKKAAVKTTAFAPEVVFESSGTTGAATSRHFVKKRSLYRKSFTEAFARFYGRADQYCILGLLPSYLERRYSSLIFMVQELIRLSRHPLSGFYLYDFPALHRTLAGLEEKGQKTILIGVTYALLDFAEKHPLPLKNTIVMETGGMKGRRQEMIRSEVHEILQNAFALKHIHSEYGMTELLSQGYAKQQGLFGTPHWMKILMREEDDPLCVRYGTASPVSGAINIIDLANLYSCSFIATDDIGRLHPDNSFEVLGRLDNSDIRGCSLMVI